MNKDCNIQIMKIKIGSTGTGSTDGLASQLLCKVNVMLFADKYNFDYVHVPFDDSFIRGNSGHRYGDFSTAFQNLVFTFPGSELVNPIDLDLKKVRRLCNSIVAKDGTLFYGQSNTFLESGLSTEETISKILEFINLNLDCELILIDGFPNLFINDLGKYYEISSPTQRVINPIFNYFSCPGEINAEDKLKIAFHVRRGDVDKERYPDRYLDESYFNNIGASLESYLKSMGIRYSMYVHTEDEDLQLDFECKLLVDPNPIRDFINIGNADIVVASRSAHSSVPPLISGSLALVPEHNWLPSLPKWIKVKDDGYFDVALLDSFVRKMG